MTEINAPPGKDPHSELLLCKATGNPISSKQLPFGVTLGDSPDYFSVSPEAIEAIPKNKRNNTPGDPDFPIMIHRGFAPDDGKGNFLAKGFHLCEFQFAISLADALKYLGLHLKPARRTQNGRKKWDEYQRET